MFLLFEIVLLTIIPSSVVSNWMPIFALCIMLFLTIKYIPLEPVIEIPIS